MEEVVGSNPISPTNKFPIWFEFNTILLLKGIGWTDFKSLKILSVSCNRC